MAMNKEEAVKTILEYIEYDDINDGLQEVAEVLDMDAVRKLIQHCGGASFSVPLLSSQETAIKRAYPELKQKGVTIRKLAGYIGRKLSTCKKMITGEIIADNQMSLIKEEAIDEN